MNHITRGTLYFAEVGDHLCEQMDATVTDDLVLCNEPSKEELKETSDEAGSGCVVVVIVVVVFFLDL